MVLGPSEPFGRCSIPKRPVTLAGKLCLQFANECIKMLLLALVRCG